MEPSPVRSRSDLHSSWLGLMEQDGKHQGWSGTESHLRGACIQAVMWSQTKAEAPPGVPRVWEGVPHPGAALCWFTLEDGWNCMSV